MIKDQQSYARNSFKLGSVRNMQKRDKAADWKALEEWIKSEMVGPFDACIGTGGNIKTLQNLALRNNEELQTVEQLRLIIKEVKALSIQERIEILGLREDRADVIPFASDIYLKCIELSQAPMILVPNVGLKDGIIEMLFQRNC